MREFIRKGEQAVNKRDVLIGISNDISMLRGDVAVARGALESGAALVTSYPGAPISGILEAITQLPEELGVVAHWSTNEKVALEEAFGASLAGQRAMAIVKNVGLNVAMDALITMTYAGCRGGLVFVVGDDPGGIGSATEQDSRFALRMVETLVLEPSNPQESKDMAREAFRLSEKLGIPVVLRTSTRVCEMSAPVKLGEINRNRAPAHFRTVPWRWSTGMGTTVERHAWLHEKQADIMRFVENTSFNWIEGEGARYGVISAGMAYNYVLKAIEALDLTGEISVLKTGTYPIPSGMVMRLLNNVKRVLVIEELEPFIEISVLSLRSKDYGAEVIGKLTGILPRVGELSTNLVTEAVAKFAGRGTAALKKGRTRASLSKPSPIWTLCKGCPHAATLSALKRAVEEMGYDRYVAPADAGCVGLGVFPPLEAVHISICMGSSIGIATGLVESGIEEPVFAVIGDSAFFHTGLSALVNAVWHDVKITVIVCDNACAAMTGLQPSPTTGDMVRAGSRVVSIKEAALGCGVEFVEEFDPRDFEQAVDCVKRGVAFRGPAVLVAKSPCIKQRT